MNKESLVTREPIKEYDDRGNCVYERDSFSYERWREFDGHDNLIYERHEDGTEWWYIHFGKEYVRVTKAQKEKIDKEELGMTEILVLLA